VGVELSVVVSTFNQPEWLALCLTGLRAQTWQNFEVLIADDGSEPATSAVVQFESKRSNFPIRHFWQENAGFRKCRILNTAVQNSIAEYLVFLDGDCIARRDFLIAHLRARRPGRFLSGGYVKLPSSTSARITRDALSQGHCFDKQWLATQGFKGARHCLKLTRRHALARLADYCSPARASWNGHNASAWKRDIYRVNGFDERMAYGGEDREFGERLERSGVTGLRIRHRAPVLHLEHERGYVNAPDRAANDRIRAEGLRDRTTKTEFGIRERIDFRSD